MKIKIGIPRALLYYKYQTLWTKFFQNLNLDVVLSPKTNKEIIDKGNQYIIDEACLSLKIFMGHVDYLKDKCDYIFIPRFACVKENEKVCTNFLVIYDLVRNCFPELKILNFNLDVENNEEEIDGFIKIGKELGFSYLEILRAYESAKSQEKAAFLNKKEMLMHKIKSAKLKIMVVAHPYNLHDEFVGKPIIKYLEKEDVTVLLSDIYDNQTKIDCTGISNTLYWTYNKELMTFIKHYKDYVDGIILVSTFPCGPDSLANELIIRRVKNIPISYITIDNNSSDTGLITRLESFIDIIRIQKERNNNHVKTYN